MTAETTVKLFGKNVKEHELMPLDSLEKTSTGLQSFPQECEDILCYNNYSYHLLNGSYGSFFYEDQDISFWQVPQLVIVIFLFVLIVFGNSCVLLAIGLSETGKKTRMNFFIMNLAIADLTVGFFHVTVDIAEKSLVQWYGGPVLCKVIRFLQELVVFASSFMLVSLSIDRVDAIARPMKFTRQAFTVRALVYAAWITSGILAAPSLFLFDEISLKNQTHCIMTLHERWHWQVYITLVAMTAFIIPAFIIVTCYTIIIFVIWDKGRGFTNAFEPPSYRTETFETFDFTENNLRASLKRNRILGQSQMRLPREQRNKGIIPQAKIRTFKMTLIIVCVFVLSWCPYFVFNLIDVYETPTMKSETQYAVTALVQSLAPLNSAANPIIYGVFSTKLCNNLRRIPFVNFLLKWVCRCCRRRNYFQSGANQSQTEQTNLDATSSRFVARRPTNGPKLFAEHETTTLLNQANNTINGHSEPMSKYIAANSKWDITETNNKTHHKVKYYDIQKKSKPFYHRRPSGLPLVTRRMTSQDTLLLEMYRINAKPVNGIRKQTMDMSDNHKGISKVDETQETRNGEITNG